MIFTELQYPSPYAIEDGYLGYRSRQPMGKETFVRLCNFFPYVQSQVLCDNGLDKHDGFYYLLAYSDEKQRMMTFRLDRMQNVKLTAEPREGESAFREIGMSGFTKRVFNMFRGKLVHVGIRFVASKLDTVIDRFGTGSDVMYTPVDAHHFILRTDVEISDAFFSWVSGFRGGAVLVEPESVVEQYKTFLKDNAKRHGLTSF